MTVGDHTTTIPAAGGNLNVSTGAVTINSSGKPGSGSSTPTYTLTVKQTDNGTVTVSPKSPKQGATVTITATPDQGYEVDEVIVTDQERRYHPREGQGRRRVYLHHARKQSRSESYLR